jgi:hypothetical protein
MSNRQRRRYRRFSFFGTSLPQKGGVVGWGARSSSSKNQQLPQLLQLRARGKTKKIHQRHGIGCVPVKLLYSESLTKRTKKLYEDN